MRTLLTTQEIMNTKAEKEKRVMKLMYTTLTKQMRVDRGLCIMIDDLMQGDVKRTRDLYEQVLLLIRRKAKVQQYFNSRKK